MADDVSTFRQLCRAVSTKPEGDHPMTFLSIPLGAHDVPFAGPLVAAAFLAFTIGFIILRLLDRVIPSTQPDTDRSVTMPDTGRNDRKEAQ
jgi:hypothetical protein